MMDRFSTREAAKRLGISHATLANYVELGKVPTPEAVTVGGRVVHSWTQDEIKKLHKLLPKIANGRKTRYQKLRTKEPQAGAPALRKKKQPKKKKSKP